MFSQSLQKLLIHPEGRLSSRKTFFWLSLSMTLSMTYSLLALQQGFDGNYVVQDDARKHIFWMYRFLDSELFPNDLIADFFQSIEPIGLKIVYRFFAAFHLDPMVVNKCLPLGLGILMTYYCFGICLQIFPIPMAAFIATTLLNQSLWMKDIFVAAIASSFSYPLFFGFLYYILIQSPVWMIIFLILEGLFYPPCVLLSAGIITIQLIISINTKMGIISDKKQRNVYLVGLIIATFLLFSYLLSASEYGPILSKAEAINLPEFYPDGRASFFNDNPIQYWLLGIRSGMLPREILTPIPLSLGLLLPIILQFPQWFPLIQKIRSSISLILQLFILSMSLFFAAHLLLFHLFLPNRYTSHSFHLIIAMMAGITMTVMIDSLLSFSIHHAQKKSSLSSIFALLIVIFLGFIILFYPKFLDQFTSPNYIEPKESELYDFLSQQPKQTRIASLSEAADNIPSFTKRSVLTAWEYAIPYQTSYYHQIHQRTLELIQAQYHLNLQPIQTLIHQYNIHLILLDSPAFTLDYLDKNPWLKQWKNKEIVTKIQQDLTQGRLPKLTLYLKKCSVYNSHQFIVLNAACIESQE